MSIRALGKQSLVYGLGHILTRLVTFLLLPLYTNHFSPKEYGIIALFYTFLSFMNVIMRYGLGAALLKFYVPADFSERKAIFSNIMVSLVITGIPFIALSIGLKDFLAPIILGAALPELIIMLGIITVLDTIWSIPMLVFRSENRPITFITLSLVNVLVTMGFNLLFILKMGLGISAVVYSNLIASVTMLIVSVPLTINRFDFKSLSLAKWKHILSFALPFLPAGLFAMIMEVADRYLLKYLTDLSTVGIYNAGYKIAMLMMLAVTGFNMGWQPFFLSKGTDGNLDGTFSRAATYVLSSLGLLWLLMILWTKPLLELEIFGYSFFGKDFLSSIDVIPWIALGYLFYGVYILMTPGIFLKNKPRYALWTRVIGAISNIGLNLLLIPLYGAIGAAIATCSSFGIMAGSMFIINRKLYPMKIEWGKVGTIRCFFDCLVYHFSNL